MTLEASLQTGVPMDSPWAVAGVEVSMEVVVGSEVAGPKVELLVPNPELVPLLESESRR